LVGGTCIHNIDCDHDCLFVSCPPIGAFQSESLYASSSRCFYQELEVSSHEVTIVACHGNTAPRICRLFPSIAFRVPHLTQSDSGLRTNKRGIFCWNGSVNIDEQSLFFRIAVWPYDEFELLLGSHSASGVGCGSHDTESALSNLSLHCERALCVADF
jgi:hypothetical protein